jgi:glyoxylase-like metal-dependent hydrolase (beta-lactamase superfamily II)
MAIHTLKQELDMAGVHEVSLSRRRLLAGISGAAAAGFVGGTPMALAKAPMQNMQAPAFYRFKVGDTEATVVSDGPLPLGEPKPDIFLGLSKEELGKTLADNFLPVDNVVLQQNALVINSGDRVVLFDTGMGTNKMLGADTGRLTANLKASGIEPQDVDAVVLTHAHPDHCFGLMTDDGARIFPNAQIYMTQADFDFWTDEGKLSNEMLKAFIAGARKQLLPNRDRMVFVKDGQEFLPGVQAMAAPGHTVGHTVYLMTSQGKTICNAGDIAHHHVLVVERPRLEFSYDTDGKQAVSSRLHVFDMLAAQRIPFVTYHFPWPGLGHLAKQGDGFRYVPAPLQMVL